MGLRLVQAGSGDTRPFVLVYHAASVIDERLKLACGPNACIVSHLAEPSKGNYSQVGKNGLTSVRDLGAELAAKVGASEFAPVVLVGFSEGCQGIRSQLRHDIEKGATTINGVVAVDGVHSSLPIPQQGTSDYDFQLRPWVRWLTFSDWGARKDRASVFTHSEIVPGTYSSVRSTLESIFLLTFGRGLSPSKPALHAQGNIEVWSFPGTTAKDHSHQLLQVLPRALNRTFELLGVLQEKGAEHQALEAWYQAHGAEPLDPQSLPGTPPKTDPQKDDGKKASLLPLVAAVAGIGLVAWIAWEHADS